MKRTRSTMGCLGTLVLTVGLLGSGTALALEKEFVDKPADDVKVEDGWIGSIKLAGNASLNGNHNVVGKTPGTSFAFGGDVNIVLNYGKGPHEWRNTFQLSQMWSKIPTIDSVAKAGDKIFLDSIYLYHLKKIKWLGPFGRVGWETAMFPGSDVRPDPITYATTRVDGSVLTEVGLDSKHMTDAFSPMMFKESVGMFAQLLARVPVSVELRLGLGAREAIADGQYALKDDTETEDILEVVELQDYAELGAESTLTVWGNFYTNKVSYKAYAETLLPFVSTNADAAFADLVNFEAGAELSFKLVSWASLLYEFKIMRIPQLLNDWQVINNLRLSVNYTYLTHAPADAAKTDTEKLAACSKELTEIKAKLTQEAERAQKAEEAAKKAQEEALKAQQEVQQAEQARLAEEQKRAEELRRAEEAAKMAEEAKKAEEAEAAAKKGKKPAKATKAK